MRETGFIKQNKEKWVQFEQTLKQKENDPDNLSNLFVQVTDDLSYSRTFYPNRSVRVYLNNLAQQIFQSIYKNKKERGNRFVIFWKDELPHIMYQARRELLVSFLLFTLSIAIGVLSSAYDPEFYRLILGDAYVEMTKANIRNGDPMAVYKEMNGGDTFLYITLNNLRVAFFSFVLGVIMTIGTVFIMIYNGIMVGAFQYFFIEQGLFRESFLTIWMHGTLEISCIVIAGTAGIVMGNGIVFPGTYSRLQSFQLSARRGIKIMLGITPIIIFAAFIEVFVTRYTDIPDPVRLVVILFSLFFILGYFVWYPRYKAGIGFEHLEAETRLNANGNEKPEFTGIKSSGEIFVHLFLFYRIYFKQLLGISIVIAAIYTLTTFLVLDEGMMTLYIYYGIDMLNPTNYFYVFKNLYSYLNYGIHPFFYFANTIFFSLVTFTVYYLLSGMAKQKSDVMKVKTVLISFRKYFLPVFICTALINLPFFIGAPLDILLFALISPFVLLLLYSYFYEQRTFISSAARCWKILRNNWLNLFGLTLILSMLGVIYFFVFNSPFLFFYFQALTININLDEETINKLFHVFMTFISMCSLGIIAPILLTGIGLKFHSLVEINEANEIKERISNIGIKKQRYGMDAEN